MYKGGHFLYNPGGASGKEHVCRHRRLKRCEFDPWIGKIPWRRTWQPTPVFLPGKSHEQRSLMGYSPWAHKDPDTQFSSVTQLCPTLCDSIDRSTPAFPVHHQLLELTQTHVHGLGDAIKPSYPLLSPSPPAFYLSQHQGFFSSKSVFHIRCPKYWNFSLSISPSNKYLGLISFRIDWLDLLAVQESLKSLLQHHSSKASILRRSAFFIVQF